MIATQAVRCEQCKRIITSLSMKQNNLHSWNHESLNMNGNYTEDWYMLCQSCTDQNRKEQSPTHPRQEGEAAK